jgi:uncharacterized protein YciI
MRGIGARWIPWSVPRLRLVSAGANRYDSRHSGKQQDSTMLFVVHAIDKKDILPTRAKFYRDHRIHLDQSDRHGTDVITAGTLVADDGETPVGSIFVVDAETRQAVDAFVRSDPYHVNGVWGNVQIHGYNKKRGTPIVSRRTA